MTPSQAAIRSAVKTIATTYIDWGNRESLGLFPIMVRTDGAGTSPQTLYSYLEAWLGAESGEFVSILAGPVGTGKTIATAQAARTDPGRRSAPLFLWVPFGEIFFFESDPHRAIREMLQRFLDSRRRLPLNLWGVDTGIRCIVLDGLDEALCQHDRNTVIAWIQNLVNQLRRMPRPARLLLVGRDVALGRHVLDEALRGLLEDYSRAGLRWIQMEPLADAELRPVLREALTKELGDAARAEHAMAHVSPGLLSSPLLLGQAASVVATWDRQISSAWGLTELFVNQLIQRECRAGGRALARPADRRRAVQELSFYLSFTGGGTPGLTLREIDGLRERGVFSPAIDSLSSGSTNFLILRSLLAGDGSYAPFHTAIQCHLAGERLDGLEGVSNDGPGSLPDPPVRDPLRAIDLSAWWREITALVPQLGSLRGYLSQLTSRELSTGPSQPTWRFHDVLTYWISHRLAPGRLSAADVPDLPLRDVDVSAVAVEVATDHGQAELALAVVIRNALLMGITRARIPRILYRNSAGLTQDERDRIRAIALDLNVEGPLEFGRATDGGQLALIRDATLQQAGPLIDRLNLDWDRDRFTTHEPGEFRDYLIDHLIVEIATRSFRRRFDAHPSTELVGATVELVLREAFGHDAVDGWPRDDNGWIAGCRIWIVRRSSDERLVGAYVSLETAGVVSRDELRVDVDDPTTARSSALVGPLPRGSRLLPDLVNIPGGTALVWARERPHNRRIDVVKIPDNISLARDLVTVSQYALFLEHSRRAALPDQSAAGWERRGDHVTFNKRYADLPVAGVSADDVRAYIVWLQGVTGRDGFCLPDPTWLQVAALAQQLEEPSADGLGPFGHKDITGRLWQWTSEFRENEQLSFGGSIALGQGFSGSAQKALLFGYPDLCRQLSPLSRDPNVGFRVGFVGPEQPAAEMPAFSEEEGRGERPR